MVRGVAEGAGGARRGTQPCWLGAKTNQSLALPLGSRPNRPPRSRPAPPTNRLDRLPARRLTDPCSFVLPPAASEARAPQTPPWRSPHRLGPRAGGGGRAGRRTGRAGRGRQAGGAGPRGRGGLPGRAGARGEAGGPGPGVLLRDCVVAPRALNSRGPPKVGGLRSGRPRTPAGLGAAGAAGKTTQSPAPAPPPSPLDLPPSLAPSVFSLPPLVAGGQSRGVARAARWRGRSGPSLPACLLRFVHAGGRASAVEGGDPGRGARAVAPCAARSSTVGGPRRAERPAPAPPTAGVPPSSRPAAAAPAGLDASRPPAARKERRRLGRAEAHAPAAPGAARGRG